MSKPVYESVQYAGTKFRYMGCFKPTKFIQLTDTPESYEGEAGKIVKVKDDETGLEFGEGSGCEICPPVPGPGDAGKVIQVNPAGDGYELVEGGGSGFDCDDLLECSIIQQILTQIQALAAIVSEEFNTSVPPVEFGLLYNGYVAKDDRLVASPGWHIPREEEIQAIWSAIGGAEVAGGQFKLDSLDYWIAPNTGATNFLRVNVKGKGQRTANGTFVGFKTGCSALMFYTPNPSLNLAWRLGTNTNESQSRGASNIRVGHGLYFIKDSTEKSDGESGFYVGNNKRIYRTIVVAGYEITADPSCETHYRNGDEIPEVTDASEWGALTSGALCAFNNDWSTV